MAQVPKAAGVASPQPVPSARVAAVATSQVDALNAGTNISFDAAASGFQDNQKRPLLGEERRDRPQAEPRTVRLFRADSQVFAKIFEERSEAPDARGAKGKSTHGGTVADAIGTYETNALVISGNNPIRGTTFSFNL